MFSSAGTRCAAGMLARVRSASVPAKLGELHRGGEGFSVGEQQARPLPQVKPVPLTRVTSLSRICEDWHEDRQELLACSDSVPEDVPNWVIAMRSGLDSGNSSLFAGKRGPRRQRPAAG